MPQWFPAPSMAQKEYSAMLAKVAERRLRLINDAGNWLRAAFPGAAELVTPLASAALDAWVTPIHDEIQQIASMPQVENERYHSPETMIRLTGERDKLVDQIARMEAAMEKIAQTAPGMDEVFRATALPMLQHQLEATNREISEVQQFLEQQQAPPPQEEHGQ